MNIQSLGTAIADARRAGQKIAPDWPVPAPTMEDAMAVQRAAFEAFRSPSIGWKAGATNAGAQAAFGLDGPFYGPMAEVGLHKDGDTIAKTETVMAVEPEFAFRMARDFPADGEAVDAESVKAAVAACHLVLEVIGRCVSTPEFQNGIGLTMEFAGNAAFVVGPEVPDWTDRDLAAVNVEGQSSGEVVQSGSGANVMGAPLISLEWMARILADAGTPLKAGDWVSTGTCTQPVPAIAGATVTGLFEGIGEVSVSFR